MVEDIKTIGFIGIGVMGEAMAGHLLAAGYKTLVYTRTRAKAHNLIEAGAVWSASPADLAAKCDAVFTMVGYPSDVEEVYFGDSGILAAARPGTLLIDMTTSRPDLAARIFTAAAVRGLQALDAPVSGGDIGAKNATLTIMAGGDESAFDRATPLLEKLGKTIVLQGGPGAGQHTKMANQISVAGALISAIEAITYAKKAGLDPRRVLVSIGSGSASSWQLNNSVPRMLDGNFNPGFYIKHFLKDLRIALESAEGMGLNLPFLNLARNLYARATAEGMGELGTQALYLLYERGLA